MTRDPLGGTRGRTHVERMADLRQIVDRLHQISREVGESEACSRLRELADGVSDVIDEIDPRRHRES